LKKAYLLLEDGTLYPGKSFGAAPPFVDQLSNIDPLRMAGELFFNTSMLGYHEILSDPSCTGQLVVMTYPHIGNYGADDGWTESHLTQSDRMYQTAGIITRSYYEGPVPEGRETLEEVMIEQNVPGISEVDTRKLTLELRDQGNKNGVIISPKGEELTDEEISAALAWLQKFPPMVGRNLISTVGIRTPETVNPEGSPHVVIVDCGVKENIIRNLVKRGAKITLVAYTATKEEIESYQPDACLISNGPGDPSVLTDQIQTVKSLVGTLPLFGICLGYQLIALALGAVSYKMEFGHHGGNHPVRDAYTGKTFVTSQNHGFAVRKDSLPEDVSVWFTNANDKTLEGINHKTLPILAVQFHPEAAPGPQDSDWIFDQFIEKIQKYQQ